MFRSLLVGLAVLGTATVASAQPKGDPIPPPRLAPGTPMPMPPVVAPPTTAASPGTLWSPYQPQKYPVPGQIVTIPGNAYGYLPARAVYGPAASPLDYPYHAFTPGYPYPGYTSINPYPRTMSSYSYGPTAYPMYRGYR